VTPNDIMALLAEAETDYPVNDWTVRGTRVWPLIRGLLYYELSHSPGAATAAPSIWRRLRDHAGRVWNSMVAPYLDRPANLPRTAAADAFFLTYSNARQARLAGKHFDIRCGPVQELFRQRHRSTHIWEYSFTENYRAPRYSPSYLVQREFYQLHFRQALGFGPPEVRLPRYPDFIRAISARGAPSALVEEDRVVRRCGYLLALADRFDTALQAIRPAAAFAANAGPYDFALHLACRRRGIPSVELQHGTQGPLHGQYASWNRVPEEGYDLLPHVFWCWDEESARTINEWSARCRPRHQAVVTGVPWFDYCASVPPEQVDPELAARLRRPGGRKRGLITLQPPEKVSTDGKLIPDFVLEALERIGPAWSWWIRLHPTMPADLGPLRSLLQGRAVEADLEAANDIPLYFLLRGTDLHLTHSSATVMDARLLGVSSVVWSDLGTRLYARGVQEGWCATGTTAGGLEEAVRLLSVRATPPPEPPAQGLDPAFDQLIGAGAPAPPGQGG
jgi:hypothetical protein